MPSAGSIPDLRTRWLPVIRERMLQRNGIRDLPDRLYLDLARATQTSLKTL
jgi:hypothetical protein